MRSPKGGFIGRREALMQFAAFCAASPVLRAQQQGPRALALDDMVNVFDFDEACRIRIAREAYDFVAGGADDEWTVRRNRSSFEKIVFRPRLLQDVSKLDLSLDLFGSRIEMPILVAPTGTHGRVHPNGEPETARGVGAAKTIMSVSNTSSFKLEDIAKAATCPLLFQLYPGPDAAESRAKVESAVALGCKAVLVTVDAPYYPNRERDIRNRLVRPEVQREIQSRRRRTSPDAPPPPAPKYGLDSRFVSQLTWPFIGEVAGYAKVPVLVKGVLTDADAKKAIAQGAAGVVVSNHGGRYLDGAPSTIEMLPEVVDAIGGRGLVLIDGGFRRGTDVLKALALGAKAVFVGRPPLWGLGAYGQVGVTRVLQILQTELARAMALAGCPNLAAIDRSLVVIDR